MRTFIAITVPAGIRDSLARLQGQLKNSGAEVKWVEPQNMHLTLKFLGEIQETLVEKIAEIMQVVAAQNPCFGLQLSTVGAFPHLNSPRVIWVGAEPGDKESKKIAKELAEKIQKLGIPKENKPFSAHITLGRTKSALHKEGLSAALKNLGNDFRKDLQEFQVTKLTLYKSTLTPRGPIYEVLKEANLKDN
jgi:2'-5' RNA ligase